LETGEAVPTASFSAPVAFTTPMPIPTPPPPVQPVNFEPQLTTLPTSTGHDVAARLLQQALASSAVPAVVVPEAPVATPAAPISAAPPLPPASAPATSAAQGPTFALAPPVGLFL